MIGGAIPVFSRLSSVLATCSRNVLTPKETVFVAKMTPSCEIVTSERGNKLLAVEGFKYYRSKALLTGEVKWRCTLRYCTAKLYTGTKDEGDDGEGSKCSVLRMAGVHNHDFSFRPRDQDVVESANSVSSSSEPESDKLTIDFTDEQVITKKKLNFSIVKCPIQQFFRHQVPST